MELSLSHSFLFFALLILQLSYTNILQPLLAMSSSNDTVDTPGRLSPNDPNSYARAGPEFYKIPKNDVDFFHNFRAASL